MPEENDNKRQSQEIFDELIKISSEEKEEKEAKIIELKKDIESKYYGIKKPLIIEAKNSLIKEGFQKDKVLAEIIRKLEGYISEPYIRRCVDDPELKDQAKVRKQIEVTAGGEQIATSEGDNGSDGEDKNLSAREEYERNKYYKNMPSIKNTTLETSSSMPSSTQQFPTEDSNESQRTIRELKNKIDTMEHERNLHTTVIINKAIFGELAGFIEDKKTKRIYLDFDENYTATKVRVEI